jgi:hypothetical protein
MLSCFPYIYLPINGPAAIIRPTLEFAKTKHRATDNSGVACGTDQGNIATPAKGIQA